MVAVVHAYSMYSHGTNRPRPTPATAPVAGTAAAYAWRGLADSTAYLVDWGEGAPDTTATSNGSGVLSASHAFASAGKYTLSLRNAANSTTVEQVDVEVSPGFTVPSITHNVLATFGFAFQPGVTYSVDWGDGTSLSSITGAAGTNEVQTLTASPVTPTGGTFDATINSVAVTGIPWNASVPAFQALVDGTALSGDVTVGGSTGAWTLTYSGTLTHTNVPAATITSHLTPGGTVTVTTTTPGDGSTDEVQLLTRSAFATGGTFDAVVAGQTLTIPASASVSAVQALVDAKPTLVGNVVVGGSTGAWTFTFVDDLGGTNVATITTDPTNLTGGTSPTVSVATNTPGVVPGSATATHTYATAGSKTISVSDPRYNEVVGTKAVTAG